MKVIMSLILLTIPSLSFADATCSVNGQAYSCDDNCVYCPSTDSGSACAVGCDYPPAAYGTVQVQCTLDPTNPWLGC